MKTKLITKSFERLLEKGVHRGFITYEELGKSLGKRNSSHENLEKALIILFDKKVTLVSKKSEFQSLKKKEANQVDSEKSSEKSDDPIRMYLREMGDIIFNVQLELKGDEFKDSWKRHFLRSISFKLLAKV